MMEYLQALVLGLLQGLTEFLPVSSSGHLILFKRLFGLDAEMFGLTFDIALHVATLVAVFILFRHDIWALLRKPFQKLTYLLILATIPAAVAGVLLDDWISSVLQTGALLGVAFLMTAAILLLSEKIGKRKKDMDAVTYGDAALIGLTQAVAIMPGLSRSGSTLSAGLLCGLKKETALRFSFLMSIPIVLGSAVLGVKDILEAPEAMNWGPLLVGMLAAGISGYLSIRFMLDFFKKRSLKGFAIYVALWGIFILVDQIFFQRFFSFSFGG